MHQPRFDPSRLDWSRHLLGPAEAELGEGVFLADLAQSLGAAMYETWDTFAPADLKPDLHPGVTILDPEEAFDAAGEPIPSVHAAFGPAVRATFGPAAWNNVKLRITDHAAWLRSHVPDPDGGPPLSAEALRSLRGEDADDPIDQDNWQFAWESVEIDRAFRQAAAERMTRVAAAIADLAIGGRIALRARPLRGGRTDVEVPATVWHGGAETRLRRLSSCGFDPAAPDDPLAEATHLIFAADEDLAEAVAAYGREHHIPITVPDETGFGPASRRSPRYPDLERRVGEFLRDVLERHGRSNWRLSDLDELVLIRFGDNLGGVVKNVRRQLVAEGGYAHLVKPGQPPKEGRPSLMPEAEIRRMLRIVE